jgi:hypothetical protein
VHAARFGTGEVRLSSLVSKDCCYAQMVKRKSGGVVVLLIAGRNPTGEKGADLGYAGERARCEDMAGTARSDFPSGHAFAETARQLGSRLWATGKESPLARWVGYDRRCVDLAPGPSISDMRRMRNRAEKTVGELCARKPQDSTMGGWKGSDVAGPPRVSGR